MSEVKMRRFGSWVMDEQDKRFEQFCDHYLKLKPNTPKECLPDIFGEFLEGYLNPVIQPNELKHLGDW